MPEVGLGKERREAECKVIKGLVQRVGIGIGFNREETRRVFGFGLTDTTSD